MPGTTPRLSLTYPSGTDNLNVYPAVSQGQMTTLDNAVLVTEGTLVARPAANSVEKDHVYKATDTAQWFISDGTNWTAVATPVSGLLSARPSAGSFGRMYYATDVALLTFDNGTSWLTVATATSGLQGSRPSAGSFGRIYYGTDSPNLGFDTGSVWLPLGLLPTHVTSSSLAASGQAIIASSNVTVSLSGSPSNGAMVAIAADTTVSSILPITVTGPNINGPGLSNAASFKLGAPGAYAVLVYSTAAVSWQMIAGQQDTGWVAMTPSTNIQTGAAIGFYTASARLVGDRVFLKGGLKNNTGGSTNSFATFPAQFQPSQNVFLSGSAGGSFIGVTVSGATVLGTGASQPNLTTFAIDGLSYTLS